ncbi:PQQ-binding-like beta-propeller repeat protein [Vulgatibacter incomptus]|uniref:Serine/threonine protein kinase related protein n=1 Tax=Vulgatibacter incomptus TaxID=1391653 RepID=A0A0K1PBW0_9BACT|nr:PQQ-binding-like beta-propeller repeat protein [Vulgatibacter incomptus]AKU90891.1 Serine/threonine protein kinase related protein [Vulgatibacter incomptus]
MVRFRIGHRDGSGRLPASPGACATLAIELDGVDVSGGRLEDRLGPIVATLCEAVARLWRDAEGSSAISIADGAYELVIARQGECATLTLAALLRPARVLFRDLEVDLDALADAASRAGSELLPHEDGDEALRLRRGIERLARVRRRPPSSPSSGDHAAEDDHGPILRSHDRAGRGGDETPSFGFDLRDDDGRILRYARGDDLHALLAAGHLYVHDSDGGELCSVKGAPFLLLRDLSDSGLRLLEAARGGATRFPLVLGRDAPTLGFDLRGAALTLEGRTLRCRPTDVARSIFSAALDLGGVLLARNARLADHPHLHALVNDARDRLELCEQLSGAQISEPVVLRPASERAPDGGPPLAPGALRRVSLRPAWQRELPPIERWILRGSRTWIRHARGLARLRLEDGGLELELPLGEGAEVAIGQRPGPFFVAERGAIACHGPHGRLLWRRTAPVAGRLRGAFLPKGSDLAVLRLGDASLCCVSLENGDERLHVEPPTSGRATWAASGGLVALAASNGLVYGIDAASARQAWRVPASQAWSQLAIAHGLVIGAVELRGHTFLEARRAHDGEMAFRVELPFTRFGSLEAMPGGVLVTGIGPTGGELVKVSTKGAIEWRARPILGGTAPLVTRAGGSIFARGAEGACRIERGKVRWNVPCGPGAAPSVARGIVALPGESLALLGADTGRSVIAEGAIAHLPAADHVVATRSGTLVVGDAEGSCAGLRLAGALAVVR